MNHVNTMDLVLKRFIVFNNNDGQGEGCEQDKLLYHWTKDVLSNKIDIAEQIDDVCMCDASIAASSRLSTGISIAKDLNDQIPNNDAGISATIGLLDESEASRSIVITFEPTVVVIIEVEPERSIWMAVHVSPEAQKGNNQNQVSITSSESVPTEAIKQVVRNIYSRFCLLNGTFNMIASDGILHGTHSQMGDFQSADIIRKRIRSACENYFNPALTEIHLTSLISNIASLNNYMIYIDLNSVTLMKVISFVNHLVAIDPNQIRHTITIFNDQLVWSSLNTVNSRLLYNYLVAVLIRDALQVELVKETDKVRLIAEDVPIYLNDNQEQPKSIVSSMTSISLDCSERSKYFLTVFRSKNNLTLGLIFKDNNQTELKQRCEQMLTTDSRLGVIPLVSLAKLVGQNFIKTSASTISAIVNSSSSMPGKRRQPSTGTKSSKTNFLNDHRYISLNRLSSSVSSIFIGSDAQFKDGPQRKPLDNSNLEVPGLQKQRFISRLLDLEPEVQDICEKSGCRVDEYFAKTTNDIWLTNLNSRYRCIYSMYKMRSSSLSDARESAIQLKTNLVINHS